MAMQCAPHCTVSVIMPTAGRPEFVEHQLTRIAAQEAVEGGGSTGRPVSEVIVVDDSPPALRVKSLVPNSVTVIRGLRVNYVVLQQRASVGAKRNMAANAATGDVISCANHPPFPFKSGPQPAETNLPYGAVCVKRYGNAIAAVAAQRATAVACVSIARRTNRRWARAGRRAPEARSESRGGATRALTRLSTVSSRARCA